MGKVVTVVVRADPRKSRRPVEALRIALGLRAGDHAVSVALLDGAPLLLSEDTEDVLDADILETYLPSLQHIGVDFYIPSEAQADFPLNKDFDIKMVSSVEIKRLLERSDSVLAF